MKTSLICLLLLGVGADPKKSIDFDTQVAPILSKKGCNAAACHGSAEGRGGFKLSLFGGDPQADFDAIVHEREGRRLRYDAPGDSLLLAKPGGNLEHEGGYRLDLTGEHADLMMQWIEQGAMRRKQLQLHDVRVEPQHFIAPSAPAAFPLRVVAEFHDADGNSVHRDVTDLAVYESSDRGAVEVDVDGKVSIKRKGRSVVVIRFMSKVLTTRVTTPINSGEVTFQSDARSNWIDDAILQSLKQLRLPASGQADETVLLRRATLDLTGRLPTEAQARAFAADKSPGRYERLIDRLLASDAFNDYWCFRLMNLLRVGGASRDQTANATYARWLREQVAQQRPMSELARDLITSLGDSHEIGPASFYRSTSGPRKQAEFISEALMGVRLRCANCHNHPLDKWTQDDYHGLAALLVNIEAKQVVRVISGRNVDNPRTGEDAIPKIPGAAYLNDGGDRRETLADWLTAADNPYFARSLVNRLWKSMMGRGLVEPADDLRATNPPTHPELLKQLESHFVDQGFRIRPLLRTIALSAAYRRSSRALPDNASDDRFYSHALVKPLEAEVQIDAICDVTGVAEQYDFLSEGARAIELFNPNTPSLSLDILGRCDRVETCETAPGQAGSGGLSTRLHLINGQLLNRKIVDEHGVLRETIKTGAANEEIVSKFYWRALSRSPSKEELEFWRDSIGSGSTRRQKLEDFLWSLLSSSTFTKNH